MKIRWGVIVSCAVLTVAALVTLGWERASRAALPGVAVSDRSVPGEAASPEAPSSTEATAFDDSLVWYAIDPAGSPVESRRPDDPVNPASVVKVATTLRALEVLGPQHRFETRFAISGSLDRSTGRLEGDLIVFGGGDPDFHVENAYLVAAALNRRGLREVTGKLLVDGSFWIGWEGGSERRQSDSRKRARLMAQRLRDALDSRRWSAAAREGMQAFWQRRGSDSAQRTARVAVAGGFGIHEGRTAGEVVATHRSNPLVRTLKRFNSYSNNDIERLEPRIGAPAELARRLAHAWGESASAPRLATLSGLGTNRLTSRQIVRLLGDLRTLAATLRLDVRELLPVAGCDPGTLEPLAEIAGRDFTGAVVAKTGTLVTTDGGTAVLAGFLETAAGPLTFSVTAPGSGARIGRSREAQRRWLFELSSRHSALRNRECGAPIGFSDDEAQVALGVP